MALVHLLRALNHGCAVVNLLVVDDYSVTSLRFLDGDIAFDHIFKHCLWITCQGVAISTATGALEDDDVTVLHRVPANFPWRREWPVFPVLVHIAANGCRTLTAKDAKGWYHRTVG